MKNSIYNRWGIISLIILVSTILIVNDIIFYKSNKQKKEYNQKFLFDNSIINLGLDLQGGQEFLLAPKIESWLINEFNNYIDL